MNEKSKFLTSLKIIFAIIYLAVTIWLVWGLIDIVISPSGVNSLDVALYLAFIVIIFGSIGYILSLIPAIMGLIYSIAKKFGKSNIIFFIVAVILPIITETIIIIICNLLA